MPSEPPATSAPPVTIQPTKLDPARLDPARLDPARLDPARLDPSGLDPARLDPAKRGPVHGRSPLVGVVWAMGVITMGAVTLALLVLFGFLGSNSVSTRPATPAVVSAVRDIARLETTELHIEKIVDLTDQQNRLFGLIKTSDAVLLVASGDVVIGVDLAKVGDDDIHVDARTGHVRLTLPEPEILSVRLDESNTYVYRRTTEILADRNEQLESRARREAVAAIEAAARKTDAIARAKRVTERAVQPLLERLGSARVEVRWRAQS